MPFSGFDLRPSSAPDTHGIDVNLQSVRNFLSASTCIEFSVGQAAELGLGSLIE